MSMDKTKDIKNEETLQHIIGYGAVVRGIQDAAEQLHNLWHDESGDQMHKRSVSLTDEMNNNYEGLKKWIGSGSL